MPKPRRGATAGGSSPRSPRRFRFSVQAREEIEMQLTKLLKDGPSPEFTATRHPFDKPSRDVNDILDHIEGWVDTSLAIFKHPRGRRPADEPIPRDFRALARKI